MNKFKMYLKNNYKLILLALILAVIGHAYFIQQQFLGNAYMVGPADQSSQMIIFKDFLYNQFKDGNFFYSFTYNGGGNFFTRLSYYYSTSIIFYITAIVTMILEFLHIFPEPDLFYWVESMLYVSIFRSAIIIVITTKFIEMFDVKRISAILGASIYAISIIYFRHTALWEMFSDALIWLPILLMGVEKIIRGKKGTIFAVGVFLTLFNNGAFAFVNLLFTGIYALIRMFFKLTPNEIEWFNQIKRYLRYGLIGVGLSLPGFVPFVLGYLQTSRLTSEVNIALINFDLSHLANFLYIDPILVIPFLFIFMILIRSNYKNPQFKFFSVFSLVLIFLRFNPVIASITNGLGHPQYRWMYITNLFIGLVIALGTQEILENKDQRTLLKNAVLASFMVIALYFVVKQAFLEGTDYLIVDVMPYLIAIQIALLLFAVLQNKKLMNVVFIIGSMATYLVSTFISNEQLAYQYDLVARDRDFYEWSQSREESFAEVVDIIEEDTDDFYRVDHFERSNFGLVYDVPTLNIYSSFQNKYQQYFNRYFQIDSRIDSNGKIDGLAGQKNLNALLQVDYIVLDNSYDYKLPSDYLYLDSNERYTVYKNDLPLAFIHPVNELYSYEQLDESTYKDELVIQGAIVPDQYKNVDIVDDNRLINELNYEVELIDLNYANNEISVTGSAPEVVIHFDDLSPIADAVVIEYTLRPLEKYSQFDYKVNDHPFELVGYQGQYSSQIFRNEIHLEPEEKANFQLNAESDYIFEIHAVHEINDQVLEERHELDHTLEYDVEIEEGKVDIWFNNAREFPFMVLPIFYETGWELEINNEPAELINTNNGMIGFEIPAGEVNINLEFSQPFLGFTIGVAFLSLLILLLIIHL